MKNNQTYKTVITAKHKIFDLHIKETLKYKDLIFLFVKRDFISKYKQTILGPLWAIIQPLLTTVVFTLIFYELADLPTMDVFGDYYIPAFLFYMAGNICWGYFSSTLSTVSNTFLNNRMVMGKVYFPRIAMPIATAFSNLISFGIQFLMFVVFWLVFILKGDTSIVVSVNLLFIPICILELMILSVGFGIIISAATTKYRDLNMLVGFGLQLWQYATPIAYGLTLVSKVIPENLMWLYMLNPVSSIVTTFRYAVFGFGYFEILPFSIGWVISLAVLFIGLLLFSRIERSFMDTI